MSDVRGAAWRAVARTEWRSSLRDGRFRWFAATGVACLLGAATVAGLAARTEREARAVAQREASAAWAGQTEKNPHAAAHEGLLAIRPATPLTALDPGLDRFTGTAVPLRAHGQSLAFDAPAMEAAPLVRLGALSVALLLQLIVPLGIVVLGHGVIAGRREDGTWRLARSQGVSPVALLVGSAAGLGQALAVVLVPSALAAGVLAVSVAGGGAPGQWSRGAMAVAAYLAYFAGVGAITIAVSARARTSRAALATLIGLWAVQSVAVPRLAATSARALAPLPTFREWWRGVTADLAQGLDGHAPGSPQAEAATKAILAEYGVTKVEDLPVNLDAILLQRSEESSDAVMARWMGRLWGQLEAQDGLVRWAAVLSPTIAVRHLSMRGAGTDLAHARDFADAAERVRRPFIRALNEDMRDHSKTGDWAYRADRALFEKTAAFAYAAPALPPLGGDIWFAAAVLVGWGVVASWWAWRGVQRSDEAAS